MDSNNCNNNVSRGFCIFCWNHLSQDTTEIEYVALQKYFTFFERYLQSLNKIEIRLRIPELVNKRSDLIGTCVKCGEFVKEFSKLFHEMKCIELKLNWKIDSLKTTLEKADRKNHSLKCTVFKDKERVDELLEFQKNFAQKCFLHLKQSYPRLTMKRCHRSNKNSESEQKVGIVPSQDQDLLTPISNVTTTTNKKCRNYDERGNENNDKRKKRPKVPAFRIPELNDLVDGPESATTSAPSIILFGTQHGLELDKPASDTALALEKASSTLNSQVNHASNNSANSQQHTDTELPRNEVPKGHVHIPGMIESIIRDIIAEPQPQTVHSNQSLHTFPHNVPEPVIETNPQEQYLPRPQVPKNNVTHFEIGNDGPMSNFKSENQSILNSQVNHTSKNSNNGQQHTDTELPPRRHVHIPSMVESIIRDLMAEPQPPKIPSQESLDTSPLTEQAIETNQQEQQITNYLPRLQAPKNNITRYEIGNVAPAPILNLKSESQSILFDNDDNDSMYIDTDAADPLGDCDLTDSNSNNDTVEIENETKADMGILSSATQPSIADSNLSSSNIGSTTTTSLAVNDRNCENEISVTETTQYENKNFLKKQLAKLTTAMLKESASSRQTRLQEFFTVSTSTKRNDNNSVTDALSENPVNLSSSVSTPMPESESVSRFRRRFKCSQCTLTFTSAGSLESHLSSVHIQLEDCNDNEVVDGVSEPEIGDEDDDAFSIGTAGEHDDDPLTSESDSNFDINEEGESETDEDEEFEEKPLKSELDSDDDESGIEANNSMNEKRIQGKKADFEMVRDLQCDKCEPWSSESEVHWRVHLAKHRYLHTNGQEHLWDHNPEHLNIKWSDLKVEIDGKLVELKEEFTAPECGRKFALKENFEHHLRLHGSYKCTKENCKTMTCCLMDLVEHESTKHRAKNGSDRKCGRCEFENERSQTMFRHYLKAHCDDIVDRVFEEYRCPICKYLLNLNSSYFPLLHFLNFHDVSRIDDPSNLHRCEVKGCAAYFLTHKQLKLHQQFHSGSGTQPTSLKPKKQNRIFFNMGKRRTKITEDGLTLENFVLKRGAKFKCGKSSCKNSTFFTGKELNIHQKLHGNFKCNFCDNVETYAPNLSRHELEAHPKILNDNDTQEVTGTTGRFSCPRCPKKSRTRIWYTEHHLEKHLGLAGDAPRCLICGYLYQAADKKELMKSIFKHFTRQHDLSALDTTGGDKVWRCEKENCKAYFLSWLQLFNHVRDIHCGNSQVDRKSRHSAECLECGRVFRFSTLMGRHMLKCHPEAYLKFFPFPCPMDGCTRRCETERILKQHVKISHPKQSDQHLCPICGRRFGLAWSLKSHLSSHDEEQQKRVEESRKRYKAQRDCICDQCGNRFKDKIKLKIHKMSHSGQDSWTFVCEVCSKKCLTKQKLEEHLRTHTKEKPFKCEHCGVSYAHRHNWRIHVQKKHGIEDVTTRAYKKVNERITAKNAGDADAQKNKIVRKRKKKDWEEEEEDCSTGESDSSD